MEGGGLRKVGWGREMRRGGVWEGFGGMGLWKGWGSGEGVEGVGSGRGGIAAHYGVPIVKLFLVVLPQISKGCLILWRLVLPSLPWVDLW
jgi:hypothetical protein